MKKILLISYHFPPSIAVGGTRTSNFAKHLPLFGWNTYVLTIEDHYLDKKVDYKRLKGLESIKIYKTNQYPTIRQAYLRLQAIYHSILKKERITLNDIEKSYVPSDNTENAFQKIKRWFIFLFLILPDTERRWIIPAVIRAVREIRQEKFDCILTSCPPYSTHIIGLLLKMIFGINWIADFRDPWITAATKRQLYLPGPLSIKIKRWLEQKVVQNADTVITTTEKLCSAFKESYVKQPQNKFMCFTNGFDMELFSKLKHIKKYEKFTLTYTGTLYFGRTPEPVFKALRELSKEGKINLEKINVKLVGECQHIDGCPTESIIQSYGLDTVVEVLEPVPYFKSLKIVKQSHLALLFAPDQPFQIPAKIFDYIGAETKILAIAGEGATSDLINSTGAGESFYPSDIEGIKEFIYQSVNNTESKRPESKTDMLHQFDRRVIIKNFADHLKSIIP